MHVPELSGTGWKNTWQLWQLLLWQSPLGSKMTDTNIRTGHNQGVFGRKILRKERRRWEGRHTINLSPHQSACGSLSPSIVNSKMLDGARFLYFAFSWIAIVMCRSSDFSTVLRSSMYIRRVVSESPIGKALFQPTYEGITEQITGTYTHFSKQKIRK